MRQTVQHLISDNMSELIVYTLEVVHIDDHIGSAGALCQGQLDLLGKIGTVPKSGHRIF